MGYQVAGVDAAGEEVFAGDFPPGPLDGLITFLRERAAGADGGLCCVIDSTNGTLDLHLMTAGLAVCRADPWLLPGRPVDGSVSATQLARAAAAGPTELAALDLASGTLGGRTDVDTHNLRGRPELQQRFSAGGTLLERGAGQSRRIALTFDDGPCPPYTDRVLDILGSYGVPASFFCVGLNVAGHPRTVRRIVEEGHSLGNHTWSHPCLPDLGREELAFQVEAVTDATSRAAGVRPRLVRPPYGVGGPDVLDWFAERDLSCVLWDNDSLDWAAPGAAAITDRVVRHADSGSIVLMHDGGGDRSQTVAALPGIIEQLLARQYAFVGVESLLPTAPEKEI